MFENEKSTILLLNRTRLSQEEIDQRLALLGFEERDREVLASSREWLVDIIDDAIQDLSVGPTVEGNADRDPDADLTRPARDYLSDLTALTLDTDYVNRRLTAGALYRRLGLTVEQYISGYSRILNTLTRAAYSEPPPGVQDPTDLASALMRTVMFDIGLALEAFAHADHRSMEDLAMHDPLTGLPNYNLLMEDLGRRLDSYPSRGNVCALFVGLDQFKSVNETLGHPVGDEILKEAARRLAATLPEECLVSRLGGDIFVIVAGGEEKEISLDTLSRAIQSTLQAPFELLGFSVDIAATLGVGITSGDAAVDAVSLMRQAEMAMYHAKAKQLTTAVFEVDMKRYSTTNLGMSAEIRRAIDADELVLFYQPKIEVASGDLVGVEALVRWIHPIKGFMAPGQFIPLAEQTALIHPLTDWVLRTAITQSAEWRRKGNDLLMSVNLAAPNLQNAALPSYLSELLDTYGVAPAAVMLEITESGLMADPHRALDTVKRFRELGVKLSIDDFGTGYSSLAYLKKLPVNEVKVDRTFVFNMIEDEKDDQIVRATINLGHSFGLAVSAEGVEDQETLDRLKGYGCDTVQGFFFSKPLPPHELVEWIGARAADRE